MSWRDLFIQRKEDASNNNYKLNLFNQVSKSTEIASMSSIKRYFNSLYNVNDSFATFSVGQSLEDVYISEEHNKIARLQDYRNMAMFHEVGSSIDMMCYSANIPNENNNLIEVRVDYPSLEAKDIERIKDAIKEYLDLFDFENNFEEYFRILVTEGQLCWENIIAKDDLEEGIIGINFIPNDAYEFCYDMKERRKFGIMITNTLADNFYLANMIGIRGINGTTAVAGAYSNLNCYEELLDEKCMVLPFDQLTYIDSGIYDDDHKIVFSALERAKRPFNQLKLIEDAILIYRVARAPEKYVFNVDIGKMSARAGEQKVDQLKKQFGTKKVYDPMTGAIGKAYDPMQMTENFWFVKGSDSQGITVSPLQAAHNFGNLEDLDYFKKNLLRSLNIPIGRFYGDNTPLINNGDESGITADELNFAKFIMSQQKRFAYGLLNGAITHLKYIGLWDAYKLTRNRIKIIINPPAEYETYRRQKLLESKVTMLKTVLGDEATSKLFSSELALELFMGWDKDKIKYNKELKFKEAVEAAKLEFLTEKIKEAGTIDLKGEDEGAKTFKEILQAGLDDSFMETDEDESEGGDEEGGNEGGEDDGSGDEFSDESTGDELGDEEM